MAASPGIKAARTPRMPQSLFDSVDGSASARMRPARPPLRRSSPSSLCSGVPFARIGLDFRVKPNGVFEEPGPKEPVSLVPSVILVPKRRKTKRRIRLGTDIGSFGWFLRSEPMYIWPDSIRLLTEGTSEGTAHYFPIWDEGARRRDAWLRGKWHAVPLEPSSRRSTTTFEGGVSARGSARGSTPPRTDATAHRARVDDMWRRAPCFANSTWTGKSRRGHAVGAALVSFPYLMVVVQRGAAGHCNTRVCW